MLPHHSPADLGIRFLRGLGIGVTVGTLLLVVLISSKLACF